MRDFVCTVIAIRMFFDRIWKSRTLFDEPLCPRRQPPEEIRQFSGHLESANLDFRSFEAGEATLEADLITDDGVHPLQPIPGACSIEKYPFEWSTAKPASLMRVDRGLKMR